MIVIDEECLLVVLFEVGVRGVEYVFDEQLFNHTMREKLLYFHFEEG